MYIKYDEYGEYGFYTPEVNGKEYCERECIQITKDLYDYLLLEHNGEYLIDVDSVVNTITDKNLMKRPTEQQDQLEGEV